MEMALFPMTQGIEVNYHDVFLWLEAAHISRFLGLPVEDNSCANPMPILSRKGHRKEGHFLWQRGGHSFWYTMACIFL